MGQVCLIAYFIITENLINVIIRKKGCLYEDKGS